jgi:hypothetical protein
MSTRNRLARKGPLKIQHVTNIGRLDHPPRGEDRIIFPSDFGRRFTIYVDTEEEFDWSKPQSRNATSTTAVQYLPNFQRMMNANGIVPAYLIDYPVAASIGARDTLRPFLQAGECEIGTQLHPWVNPPYDEVVSRYNSFAGNLPRSLEQAKLRRLTSMIADRYGQQPVVYRAGRYGVGSDTAALLDEMGYRMDVSVRPTFDYTAEGGPSFVRHDSRPYWAGPQKRLMELPLGAAYTGQLRRFGDALSHRLHRFRVAGVFARLALLSRVALTPEDMPIDDAKEAVRIMLDAGIQVLSFSFHSPSLAPGYTPYVRTAADLHNFYRWWDEMFAFLAQMNVCPASSSEIFDAAWRTRSVVDFQSRTDTVAARR